MVTGGFTDKGKKRTRRSANSDLKKMREILRWSIFSEIDENQVAPEVSELYPEDKKGMDTRKYLTLVQPIISALLKTSALVKKFDVKKIQSEAKKMVQRRREHHNNKRDTPSGCAPLVYTAMDMTLSDDEVEEMEYQADDCIDADVKVECSECPEVLKLSEAMPKVARLKANAKLFCPSCWTTREEELYLMLGIRKPKKKPKYKKCKSGKAKKEVKSGKHRQAEPKTKGKTGKAVQAPKTKGKTGKGKAVQAANLNKRQVRANGKNDVPSASTPEKSPAMSPSSQTPTRARSKQTAKKKRFEMGDSVIARWTDGRFYAAHICKVMFLLRFPLFVLFIHPPIHLSVETPAHPPRCSLVGRSFFKKNGGSMFP